MGKKAISNLRNLGIRKSPPRRKERVWKKSTSPISGKRGRKPPQQHRVIVEGDLSRSKKTPKRNATESTMMSEDVYGAFYQPGDQSKPGRKGKETGSVNTARKSNIAVGQGESRLFGRGSSDSRYRCNDDTKIEGGVLRKKGMREIKKQGQAASIREGKDQHGRLSPR